ncbi:MAG: hypothetical protein EZS28_001034 [Streblomastix strix]|uniref:Uncharacterized protein n=1 Tax=Streblomastix strix TaxID=222440 RepID=A0A5J4X971_9EUKA|nr:MAG: hypothetical protein EZS28_001034 [Streblomastix strix]
MDSKQKIQDAANAIISFSDPCTYNKERKQIEQSESESAHYITEVSSSLQTLGVQIQMNESCNSVTQIPKLLRSLITLSLYKIRIHFNKEVDQLMLTLRGRSRECLCWIQYYSDAQVQSELVKVGYGRVIFLSLSTAGGIGEEHDKEICNGLSFISWFLRALHEGRNKDYQPSFQPLPLLARRSEEQLEEEGANEEVEAQMINKREGYYDIKYWANCTKAEILNHFIHSN